jgi:hypothetical protein
VRRIGVVGVFYEFGERCLLPCDQLPPKPLDHCCIGAESNHRPVLFSNLSGKAQDGVEVCRLGAENFLKLLLQVREFVVVFQIFGQVRPLTSSILMAILSSWRRHRGATASRFFMHVHGSCTEHPHHHRREEAPWG